MDAPDSRVLLRSGGLGRGGQLRCGVPGMAACRVPERWMTQGWCHLRPGIQIEDTGGIRIVLAGSRRSPSAPLLAIGFAVRMTGPVRPMALP